MAATVDASAVHGRATIVNALVGSTSVPRSLGADFDLAEPMLSGGVTAANLTVAIEGGFAETARKIEFIRAAIDRRSDVTVAETVADIVAAKEQGRAAIVLGFQNGSPVENDLAHLAIFHRLGLRILQLTYQRRNLIADGCGEPADAGLSVFGRSVVEELNRLGILIDLSHVGARATMETIEASAAPVAFTHVNLQAFNPVPRNKTDEQIRALAERGGVVGINAIARLISPDGARDGASIDQFLDQIDHVVELVGVDHVGLGLDINEGLTEEDFARRREGFLKQYPEIGGDFPFENYYVRELKSMANLLVVTEGLLARGYSEEDVAKVLGGNFLRLFEAAWAA